MLDDPESRKAPYLLFHSRESTILQILDLAARLANEMVMMLLIGIGELVALCLGDLIDSGENPETAKRLHRPVNRRQMNARSSQSAIGFRNRQWPAILQEHVQDPKTRPG
jgi:hypothetical protein